MVLRRLRVVNTQITRHYPRFWSIKHDFGKKTQGCQDFDLFQWTVGPWNWVWCQRRDFMRMIPCLRFKHHISQNNKDDILLSVTSDSINMTYRHEYYQCQCERRWFAPGLVWFAMRSGLRLGDGHFHRVTATVGIVFGAPDGSTLLIQATYWRKLHPECVSNIWYV